MRSSSKLLTEFLKIEGVRKRERRWTTHALSVRASISGCGKTGAPNWSSRSGYRLSFHVIRR